MRLPKFRLFDYTTPGPGVDKNAPKKKGIALYWDILVRRFWKLVTLNFIFFLFSIPAFLIGWFLSSTLLSFLFTNVIPIEMTQPVAEGLALMSVYLSCLSAALFGSGAASAGMTYVIRNYCIDTHSWVWADFWSTFREKFFKATLVYVFDTIFTGLLFLNFCVYGMFAADNNIGAFLLQGFMVVIFIIFLMMHSYVYAILVSTEDSLFSVYKKSLLLALGKLPRTAGATLASVLICGIVAFLSCFVVPPVMIVIPVIMFALSTYTNLFITYPVVQKYILTSKKSEK